MAKNEIQSVDESTINWIQKKGGTGAFFLLCLSAANYTLVKSAFEKSRCLLEYLCIQSVPFSSAYTR